jgi:hypothetical protein
MELVTGAGGSTFFSTGQATGGNGGFAGGLGGFCCHHCHPSPTSRLNSNSTARKSPARLRRLADDFLRTGTRLFSHTSQPNPSGNSKRMAL